MNESLEIIEPKKQIVALSIGKEVEISPIRVRELPAMARAAAPMLAKLQDGISLPMLLASHADDLIDAVSIGARMPREDVDGLGIDDLFQLTSAVLEVNQDFFAQALLPLVAGAMGKMAGGQTPF